MSIAEQLTAIADEVSSQDTLIQSIITALDGRSAGGGNGLTVVAEGSFTPADSSVSSVYIPYSIAGDYADKSIFMLIYGDDNYLIGSTICNNSTSASLSFGIYGYMVYANSSQNPYGISASLTVDDDAQEFCLMNEFGSFDEGITHNYKVVIVNE